jgi:hypothetical protein
MPPLETNKAPSLWPLAILGILISWFSHQRKAVHPQSTADDKNSHAPIVSVIIPDVEPAQPRKTKTTCRPDQMPWWKTAFEVMAVLAGLGLLYWSIRQTHASENSADAAKTAAEIAKEAVHLSERAYITTVPPDLVIPQKSIAFVISNNGRMPSGIADIVVHWFTIPVVDPHSHAIDLATAIDKHWRQTHVTSVPPGNPLAMKLPISKVDESVLKVGHQRVIVVGFVNYNDGFPDTPTQRWTFCAVSGYQTTMKVVYMTPCDADQVLHAAELADGYPNNEDRD